MGSVSNPIDMQTRTHNGESGNEDMKLVETLANQQGIDTAHLIQNSDLLESLEGLREDRANRRERVLKWMPFMDGELDVTDVKAKENLILLTIQTYRKRISLMEMDNDGAMA